MKKFPLESIIDIFGERFFKMLMEAEAELSGGGVLGKLSEEREVFLLREGAV